MYRVMENSIKASFLVPLNFKLAVLICMTCPHSLQVKCS